MYMVCKIFLILMCLQIKERGSRGDRPTLKKLSNYVVKGVAANWEDLGIQLLNDKSALRIIKADHIKDVSIYS